MQMIFVIRARDAIRSKQRPISDLDADHHELAVLKPHSPILARCDGKLCVGPMTNIEDALGIDASQETFACVILSAGRMIPKREAAEQHIGHIHIICGYKSNRYSLAWIRSHPWPAS